MLKRKKMNDEVDDSSSIKQEDRKKSYYDVAIDWEISRSKLIESSERRAWIISGLLFFMLICSWAGLFFMLPLKKDVPYVIQVDNAKGRIEIAQVYSPKQLGTDEVRDKYWINNFIMLYERYNYYLLREDYQTIQLFTEEAVWQDYQKMYRGPEPRQKVYRDNVRIDVEMISIMVRPDRNKTAVARFKINRVNLKVPSNPIIDSRTFTVELVYGYEILALNERSRMINPLGFRVKSYQLAADNN